MTVTFEDALAAVLSLAGAPRRRTVPLPQAAGEVLAADVTADRPIPPFRRAAMDGFAIRWSAEGAGRIYRILATVNPGDSWEGEAGPMDCVRIMTGAPVPEPFDTVVPVEQAEPGPGGTVRLPSLPAPGRNVAARGEDAAEGEVVVPAGTLLRPRHVAVLAAVGCWEVPVGVRPSVAVLATGGELREPWEKAAGPFIRNSNAHYLLSALSSGGFGGARYLGIVPDDRAAISAAIREGLGHDLLILTGGVSAGDIDMVPDCLAACGVQKVLHRVSVRPGGPVFVGRVPGGAVVLGLPGNPVAVMVHFAMLVRPLLLKWTGAREYLPKPVLLPLAAAADNRGERKKFSPARIDSEGGKSRVVEIPFHGSGDFVGASRADGVFEIPLGVRHLPAGTLVRFYPVWGEMLLPEG